MAAAQQQGTRTDSWRGFAPYFRAANAHEIRSLWERRLAKSTDAHPLWMHVHFPFCPQICTFCHCGRRLLTDPSQIDEWLDRARDEVAFYAPALSRAVVRNQYFGGGTPNLLSPIQLETLLTLLNQNFRYEPGARRTLEMLPSVYSPETLEVALKHGVNRLSCGVQTTDGEVLSDMLRAPDFAPLKRLIDDATRLGFDDINVDLAWGFKAESESHFFRSLKDVLELGPTSVSVHLLAPTAKNPVYASQQEEEDVYRRFRRLRESDQAKQIAAKPNGYQWFNLPTVVALARNDYVAAGRYRSWQYSDMETVGTDMYGIGHYSLSNALGGFKYEDLTSLTRFDPDERGYSLTMHDPTVGASFDVLSDLLRDQVTSLQPIVARYGDKALNEVGAVLETLLAEGVATRDGDVLRYHHGPSLYMGPAQRLFEFANERTRELNPPQGHDPLEKKRGRSKAGSELIQLNVPSLALEVDSVRVPVVIERVRPEARYFKTIGELGLYHGEVSGIASARLQEAMLRVAKELESVIAAGQVEAAAARQEVARRLAVAIEG